MIKENLDGNSKQTDPINPSYYKDDRLECIDALTVATKGLFGVEAFCTANAIKYLWRWKKKNGVEDLKKARWYIDHLIYLIESHKVQKPPRDTPPGFGDDVENKIFRSDGSSYSKQMTGDPDAIII
jgi:hypothetical protein